MNRPPEWRLASLAHLIINWKESSNPYQQAMSRIHDVDEWFRAIEEMEREPASRPVDNRPVSDKTAQHQVVLDRLNSKE